MNTVALIGRVIKTAKYEKAYYLTVECEETSVNITNGETYTNTYKASVISYNAYMCDKIKEGDTIKVQGSLKNVKDKDGNFSTKVFAEGITLALTAPPVESVHKKINENKGKSSAKQEVEDDDDDNDEIPF